VVVVVVVGVVVVVVVEMVVVGKAFIGRKSFGGGLGGTVDRCRRCSDPLLTVVG
jgi:hypothetical protein